MNQLSDEQIVNSVLTGDTEAFSELITRYNNRVFAVGMRLFKNQDDAGDFTQEVFIRAFDKLGLFSFISPFSHWLIKLAYNYGINLLKTEYLVIGGGTVAVITMLCSMALGAVEKKISRAL